MLPWNQQLWVPKPGLKISAQLAKGTTSVTRASAVITKGPPQANTQYLRNLNLKINYTLEKLSTDGFTIFQIKFALYLESYFPTLIWNVTLLDKNDLVQYYPKQKPVYPLWIQIPWIVFQTLSLSRFPDIWHNFLFCKWHDYSKKCSGK